MANPKSDPGNQAGTTDDGMVVLSYVLAGLLLYGGLGFLADKLGGTSWMFPVGLIIGLAVSIYRIIKKYGRIE